MLDWRPIAPLSKSLCNALPIAASYAELGLENATFLQNGQTYFVTLRGTSGAGVRATTPSGSFVFISSLPAQGVVFETALGNGVTSQALLDLQSDIDFQSAQDRLLVQWTHFTHAYDQGSVAYSVILLYDGTVSFVNMFQ